MLCTMAWMYDNSLEPLIHIRDQSQLFRCPSLRFLRTLTLVEHWHLHLLHKLVSVDIQVLWSRVFFAPSYVDMVACILP